MTLYNQSHTIWVNIIRYYVCVFVRLLKLSEGMLERKEIDIAFMLTASFERQEVKDIHILFKYNFEAKM